MTKFELVPADLADFSVVVEQPEPVYKGTSERHVFYPDPCEECGGNQWDVGGRGYYNGSFQCYTLYLECENCGYYEVECV